MLAENEVLFAKFIPPHVNHFILPRLSMQPKLQNILAYPLTIVQAGAGYGKSTAVAQFLHASDLDFAWYNIGLEEQEARLFLLHLVYAFRTLFREIGAKSLDLLLWEDRFLPGNCGIALRSLLNELSTCLMRDTVLVLDDYHRIDRVEHLNDYIDPFIRYCPLKLHIVLLTRHRPGLPQLAYYQANNQVNLITQQDLALSVPEVITLFEQGYHCKLPEQQAQQLTSRTEGWVMALQMIGQHIKQGWSYQELWSTLPEQMTDLFEFLANEFLQAQQLDIRQFLLESAQLDELDACACDAILQRTDSEQILSNLEQNGMFTFRSAAGHYRYHQLFHEFLRRKCSAARREQVCRQAVDYYRHCNRPDQAVVLCLRIGDHEQAAYLIEQFGASLLGTGRFDYMMEWLNQLPEALLRVHPGVALYHGDCLRYSGQYEQGLAVYRRALSYYEQQDNHLGMCRSLTGMAKVYIDTIQPGLTEQYLNKALTYVPKDEWEEKAALLKLMAENLINKGEAQRAERLYQQINELWHEAIMGDVEARMFMRSGRLVQARHVLLYRHDDHEQQPYKPMRSFRETPLLLSMICSMMGDTDEAQHCAEDGIALGDRFDAAFIQGIGYVRLAHALQLRMWPDDDEPRRLYFHAIELFNSQGLERGKAEALMGLCLLHSFGTDPTRAVHYGQEALAIVQHAKDEWLAGFIRLSLGIAYYYKHDYEVSGSWMGQALLSLQSCGDSFGQALVHLWMAQRDFSFDQTADTLDHMEQFIGLMQQHGYEFLLFKNTLFGLRDIYALAPILLAFAQHGSYCDITAVLNKLQVRDGQNHPGYSLRIQTFGQFKVWRGNREVTAKEYHREKAKKMLQLLVTRRKTMLHKETMIELLWPDETGSDRDFKVALNALVHALEPEHSARMASFFIRRDGMFYGLDPSTCYIVDVDEFEMLLAEGNSLLNTDKDCAVALFQRALRMYRDDYLADCRYEDWCMAERERLKMQYIATATKVAEIWMQDGRYEEVVPVLQTVVNRDGCWEQAYRMLMICHHKLGNRSMVLRLYRQCCDNLKRELNVVPMPETVAVFEQISQINRPG